MDKVIWSIIIWGIPLTIFIVGIYSFWKHEGKKTMEAIIYTVLMLIAFVIFGYILQGSECFARPGLC